MKKTLTKHLEKDNTGKGEVPAMSLDTSEFLFFDIAREASNDVNTFLNLRFIKKQKPAVFWGNSFEVKVNNVSLNIPNFV